MPKKKKYLSGSDLQKALFLRTEGYAANVRTIYQNAFSQIIDIVKGTYLVDGTPFSFSEYGYTDEVQPILRRMYSQTYQTIRGGVQQEWLFASENNDELVKAVFGEHSIEDNHFARYFLRNREAMDAFFARKTEGLNLSQKVWNYTSQFKGELEGTLDLAIGEGTPANRLASKIQEYLNEPDRWYRRFRVKIGEDEDGNPIYGRKWKRRVFDKETDTYQWIDDDPKHYHPGRGVYRSSYRNAQRLARTETNIAYRTADYDRWQRLDFVVGVEIKLSNNHPEPDICDDLKGIYPKDFKWTGWHPNCRCYMVPVLAPQSDIDKMLEAIMDGEEPGSLNVPPSENEVRVLPGQFKEWRRQNQLRIDTARERGTLPYFIRDNWDLINGTQKARQPLTPEQQARRKEIREAAKALTLLALTHPAIKHDIRLSNADIKEWLNQPHRNIAAKNEALLTLPELLANAEYLGTTPDPKGRKGVAVCHIFKVQIGGEDSYIIVQEMTWGDYKVHSVSDTNPLKKK